MNTRIFSLGGLLAVSAFGLSFGAPSAANAAMCWSGYHADSRGDCQPNIPLPNHDDCPPGLINQVWPNAVGYICVPEPRGY